MNCTCTSHTMKSYNESSDKNAYITAHVRELTAYIKTGEFNDKSIQSVPHGEHISNNIAVRGDQYQDGNIYYSPAISKNVIRTTISQAIHDNDDMAFYDMTSAFIQCRLPTKKYIHISQSMHLVLNLLPPAQQQLLQAHYDKNNTTKCVIEVGVAMYGWQDSAQIYYEHIKTFLEQHDFHESNLEPCMFIRNSSATRLMIFVDDYILKGKDKTIIK
eukprot:Pgem_evm1s8225